MYVKNALMIFQNVSEKDTWKQIVGSELNYDKN
jgi:hypothetical protein